MLYSETVVEQLLERKILQFILVFHFHLDYLALFHVFVPN